jgi:hypothetical protein
MKTPIEYIREAWRIYSKKENFIYFSKVMAVFAIVSAISGLISVYYPDYINNQALAILLSILAGIFMLWSGSVSINSVLNMGKLSEREVLVLGFKNMLKYFAISFVVGLLVLLGFVALIVPGIIFMTWFYFATLAVFDKKMGIFASMKESKKLVKDKFWKILGRSFVFGLFIMIVSLVVGAVPYLGSIISVLLAPFFLLPQYLLYKDLVASGGDTI